MPAFLGVLLNFVAVFSLRDIPHTYRPGDVPAWLEETLAHPTATTVSGWSFTIGLVALAAFFFAFAATLRSTWVTVGASFFAFGALLDAAGTLAPIAALHVARDSGLALLWLTLLLDSAFNGLLGLGLLAFAWGLPADWPKPHRWLAAVTGLASLPVGLQFMGDGFARLLAVAGPLWLGWIVWAAIILERRRVP